MAVPSLPLTVPGRVVALSLRPGFDGDVQSLQLRFTTSLARAAALTRILRGVMSVLAVVGLAFVASRLEAPIGVGVCGLLVVAPAVWLGTGLFVPLLVLQRGLPHDGGPLAMHSGVPITFDASGIVGGSVKAPWSAATWVGAVGDAVVLRGHDAATGLVFEVAVSTGVLGETATRDGLIEALRAKMTTGA